MPRKKMPRKKKNTKKRTMSKSKRTAGKKTTASRKTARKAATKAGSLRQRKRRAAGRALSRRRAALGGEQSGDLQTVSHREVADSESVDELLEEGNAFEAGVVAGVQKAEDSDEQEVRTHEVPEDDVPGEYLDRDS